MIHAVPLGRNCSVCGTYCRQRHALPRLFLDKPDMRDAMGDSVPYVVMPKDLLGSDTVREWEILLGNCGVATRATHPDTVIKGLACIRDAGLVRLLHGLRRFWPVIRRCWPGQRYATVLLCKPFSSESQPGQKQTSSRAVSGGSSCQLPVQAAMHACRQVQ